jgi:hypothetical protein
MVDGGGGCLEASGGCAQFASTSGTRVVMLGCLSRVDGWSRRTGPFAAEITSFTARCNRTPLSVTTYLETPEYLQFIKQSAMPTTLQEFESVWPRIRADIQAHAQQYKLPQQSLDWFTKVH